MAKEKKQSGGALSDLVGGYNKMMEDPKQYAQTTYAAQIKEQGRTSPRDARTKAQKPWNKNDIPS